MLYDVCDSHVYVIHMCDVYVHVSPLHYKPSMIMYMIQVWTYPGVTDPQ